MGNFIACWPALTDIENERIRQEELKASGKFAHTCADDGPPTLFFTVLAEEVGEVARAVLEGEPDNDNLREELIQVAAVAVAWVEGIDRRREDQAKARRRQA